MKQELTILIGVLTVMLTTGCDEKAEPTKTESNKTGTAKSTPPKEDAPAKKAAAPTCDKVVDHIASFDPASGAAEKKLWKGMCDDMNDKQRTCVFGAKDQKEMGACMKDMKLK